MGNLPAKGLTYLAVVKLTLGEVRVLVREALAGSHPSEAYDHELMDDPAVKKRSVMVPDDIKRQVRRWTKAMGLSRGKKKRLRSS